MRSRQMEGGGREMVGGSAGDECQEGALAHLFREHSVLTLENIRSTLGNIQSTLGNLQSTYRKGDNGFLFDVAVPHQPRHQL
jgi:hypothetical protein